MISNIFKLKIIKIIYIYIVYVVLRNSIRYSILLRNINVKRLNVTPDKIGKNQESIR